MKTGLILPNILSPVNDAETLTTTARLAEDSGFDSIWASDHVLTPREHERYGNAADIIVTLSYMAAITKRVELGTGVLLLPMRNPLVIAKQFATLDVFSGGRTILGVGVGWLEEEFRFMNADFGQRGKRMDEYIEILRKLWTEDDPVHEGTYSFNGVISNPKPTRVPPIYIGGESDAAIKRAARIGDGWIPNGPRDNLRERVAYLRELAGERQVTVAMSMRLDMREGSQAALDRILDQTEQGLEYVAIRFWHDSRAALIAQIEQFASDVLPSLRSI
jgi:probable F420-dependent oxidoreductase